MMYNLHTRARNAEIRTMTMQATQATAWKVSPRGTVVRANNEEDAVVRSAMMNNDRTRFVCSLTSLSFEGNNDEGRTVRGSLMVSDWDYGWESGVCYVIAVGEFVPSKELVRAAVSANAESVFYKRSLIRRFLEWID